MFDTPFKQTSHILCVLKYIFLEKVSEDEINIR